MRAPSLVIASIVSQSSIATADEAGRRLYEIAAETTMPHLEENLRYANTLERRCLARDEMWSSFPVLQHAALKGCKLELTNAEGELRTYALVCGAGSETTGRAVWQARGTQLRGALTVKLGGKNMTFAQSIVAKPLGACAAT